MRTAATRTNTSFAAIALALACGCGARTGLHAPDVGWIDSGDDSSEEASTSGLDANVGLPPVDPTCPGACPYRNLAATFPPFVTLAPPDVPAACANGFELGGANGGCGGSTYTLLSTRVGGANAITLDVDFATYREPDGVTITGIDGAGRRYTLFQSCRLQTAILGGPSTSRPSDNTIRQFRLAVRAGTTRLDFDFGAVVSPMYIQVLGLCDFAVSQFPHAAWWQAVP